MLSAAVANKTLKHFPGLTMPGMAPQIISGKCKPNLAQNVTLTLGFLLIQELRTAGIIIEAAISASLHYLQS